MVLAFSILGLFFIRPEESRDQFKDNRKVTSYSPKPRGVKAFYLLLDKLNIPAERWERRLSLLASQKGMLLVIKPEQLLDKREIKFIKKWVSEGNILFYADDRRVNSWKEFGVVVGKVKPADAMLSQIDKDLRFRNKIRLVYPKTSLRLLQAKQSSRRLLWDKNGVIVSETRLGKGIIYLSTDPGMFTNGMIDRKDNVLFLAALINELPAGGRVYFDEYHQGFQLPDKNLWDILGKPFYGMLGQLILLLIIIFYSIGYRFGRPREIKEFSVRTADEYVYAMASLFYRAGKWSLVQKILYKSFYLKLTSALGVSVDTPEGKLLQLCKYRWPDNTALHNSLAAIFTRIKQNSSLEELTEKSVLETTKEMERIRKEL